MRNSSGRRLLRYGIGKNPQDRSAYIAELREKKTLDNRETIFRNKDGSTFTGLVSGRLLMIHDEPHLVSVITDISEHKETERKIRVLLTEKEAQYDQLVKTQEKLLEANTELARLSVTDKPDWTFQPAKARRCTRSRDTQARSIRRNGHSRHGGYRPLQGNKRRVRPSCRGRNTDSCRGSSRQRASARSTTASAGAARNSFCCSPKRDSRKAYRPRKKLRQKFEQESVLPSRIVNSQFRGRHLARGMGSGQMGTERRRCTL